MTYFDEKLKAFAIELYNIDAIKFGNFQLKTGLSSPIYCDLRVIISHPKIMNTLAELMVEHMGSLEGYDSLCGVPYTALPIATVISANTGIPMILRRLEAKTHGTKKLIEGSFNEGDRCLIIEDVVTSGSSVLETVRDLIVVGVKATNVVVLLNREQGAEHILKQKGITMHALLTISQLLKFLKEEDCINQSTVDKVTDYIKKNQLEITDIQKNEKDRLTMSYLDRAQCTENPVAQKLFKIISKKETNLCVALDLTSSTEILNCAESLGPYVCLIKTHIDIVEDFSPQFVKHLKAIANEHNFLIMEDRKFADIGNVVSLQYNKGIHAISTWADLVTAHSLSGKGVLQALGTTENERGVFLVAEMSSADNLISDKYVSETLKLAQEFPSVVSGIVCQSPKFLNKPGLIQLTPGVQIEANVDDLGQQYNSPEAVVLERGADIAVVGRGITKAASPVSEAIKYRDLLWAAYLKRIQ